MTVKQRSLRDLILMYTALMGLPGADLFPANLAIRWLGNHLVPWAARAAFHEGIHHVNGVLMEIPRPPDWGGGGEFHMAIGTYEPTELAYILSRLTPGDTFVDVGAHIGYITLPVAKLVGREGRVIALEPSPGSAEKLRRNITLNGFDWVSVVEAAAAAGNGQADLAVSADSPMWNTLRPAGLATMRAAISVSTRSLDSVLAQLGWPAVAGIKLDVEGAESQVLEGSAEVLKRNPQAFLVTEVAGGTEERRRSSMETLVLLDSRGYRFKRLPRGRRDSPQPLALAELESLVTRGEWQSLLNIIAERDGC